jgi:dTDP-4-amino-4,6-dideoxygalactose transaminase
MKKITVGGEFFYSPFIFFRRKKFTLDSYLIEKSGYPHLIYTNGGFYSIIAILQNLHIAKNETILLPSYLCETIINAVEKINISYLFYRINNLLEIDINYVDHLISKGNSKVRAILFINYFGYSDKNKEKLLGFKKNGVVLIEDAVQNFMFEIKKPIGDYVFNSFRKFFPCDFSYILSKYPLVIEKKSSFSTYFINKQLGYILKYLSFRFGLNEALFLKKFNKCNQQYYQQVLERGINVISRAIIERSDINAIIEKRKELFINYLTVFEENKVFNSSENQAIVPLGLPLVLDNRDVVRKYLAQNRIFCPVHWNFSKTINNYEFIESYNLSLRIITIPINEMITRDHLNLIQRIWIKMKQEFI